MERLEEFVGWRGDQVGVAVGIAGGCTVMKGGNGGFTAEEAHKGIGR